MQKHKAVLAPKFEIVLDTLESELVPVGIGTWTKPNGGYFVSIDVLEGTAKRVVALCREAGLVLTGAGATYPNGFDPKDANIRIAPSFPPNDELQLAMDVFCICVKLRLKNCWRHKRYPKEERTQIDCSFWGERKLFLCKSSGFY